MRPAILHAPVHQRHMGTACSSRAGVSPALGKDAGVAISRSKQPARPLKAPPLGCCVRLHADPIVWPGCEAWWRATTCSRHSASRRFCTSSSRHLSQGAGPAAAAVWPLDVALVFLGSALGRFSLVTTQHTLHTAVTGGDGRLLLFVKQLCSLQPFAHHWRGWSPDARCMQKDDACTRTHRVPAPMLSSVRVHGL